MRRTPHYMLTEESKIKCRIRESSWAIIVSNTANGLVASHYPIVLDESAEGVSIVNHVRKPDERLHESRRATSQPERWGCG